MRTILKILCLLVAVYMVGCKDIDYEQKIDFNAVSKSETTYVVVVGMETSSFAGSCSGAAIDAQRMSSLLSHYTTNIKSFYDESATKSAVKEAMSDAAEKADLFIFYYSGHGGQGRMKWSAPDESDGLDEFLCLYDTYMLDDEVWSTISKCKGRVMCIFDACHSETIFKLDNPFSMRSAAPFGTTHNETGSINLLVWSGCQENASSYGNAKGGKLTNTILKYFNSNASYDYLWNAIENDDSLKRFEIVQRTIIGGGFTAKAIFK